MKIILDAMGGDHAPKAPVEGALSALKDFGCDIVLVGRTDVILEELKRQGLDDLPRGLEIANATEVIEMGDDPAYAFKQKKDSSMTVGLDMLKSGVGDAFVSAGSTGALLSAATLMVKRIRGIRRACMTPIIPNGAGGCVLADCGANADCTPEYLLQFAYMGSYYAKKVMGREVPRVGLLNIGSEDSKGNTLCKETFPLLKQASDEGRLHFVGNVEPGDLLNGKVDVAVADGFTGNVCLKTLESTGMFLAKRLKGMLLGSFKTKLAALALKSDLKGFMKLFDSREVGGTAIMGISKTVIKAHGSSDGYAIRNAIRQAITYTEGNIIEDITANVEYMKLPAQDGSATEKN